MSLQEFWMNVRIGAKFVRPATTVDSAKLDASGIEAMLRQADLWLTPQTVEGFEEEDFEFLSPEEQVRLKQCVDNFLAVARQVAPNGPATDEQFEAALPAFQEILEILRPDKYGDAEALAIGKQVEQRLAGKLPDWVIDLYFETDTDWTGAPAIWVWAVLADAALEDDVLSENSSLVRAILDPCLRKIDAERWPFIRFRNESDRVVVLSEHSE